MNALKHSNELIKQLYLIFEDGYFQPKEIGKIAKNILLKIENDNLNKHIQEYIPVIWKLIVVHQTKQLSQSYSSMKLETFKELLVKSFSDSLKILLESAKSGLLSFKINYEKQIVYFGENTLEKSGISKEISEGNSILLKINYKLK